MVYKRVCVDCKTSHGAYEGELDDYGYLNLKWECPKCKKQTQKRIVFNLGPRVSVLSGMSWRDHRERGGRPPY